MFLYHQLKCLPGYQMEDIRKALSHKLHIPVDSISDIRILKESLDARKKPDLFYSLSVVFQTTCSKKLMHKKDPNLSLYEEKQIQIPYIEREESASSPVVIGAGPAGLFCAYYLAKAGLKPIVYERGKCVESRQQDVLKFWETGILDTESNVQFGEGGAGTFSDGKLNTLNKDPFGYQKEVLRLFVEMGADPRILYEQKPHIGTDCLIQIVKNLRNSIIRMGGEVLFSSQVTDILWQNHPDAEINADAETDADTYPFQVQGVVINHTDVKKTDQVVLAVGHSARDTFRMLYQKKVPMEAKAFAVGYRVQHLQRDIDSCQYGEENIGKFPAAAYKVTAQTSSKRGVYSFCMCPGGYVVNASSEKEKLCVNGMSYHDRNSKNANSAIIVSVDSADFKDDHPLSGVLYQEEIEKRAYAVCNGKIPVQRYIDFKNDIVSTSFGNIQPEIKGLYAFGNHRGVYSEDIENAFIEGMTQFGKKMKGFDRDDVLITGIEPRTSSPVRIHRNKCYQSPYVKGLFPCGEGAGYAGGITSAACDGLKIALEIMTSLGENQK